MDTELVRTEENLIIITKSMFFNETNLTNKYDSKNN